MDPFIGEIRAFGFYFPPRGWALCNGALLSISQNTALFALIGTQFGGNGTSNFALPNLQGSIAVGAGQGPGLSNYVVGQTGGAQTVTLTQQQMPAHVHPLPANATGSGRKSADPNPSVVLGGGGRTGQGNFYVNPATQASSPAVMASANIGIAGSNQPHNNMAPSVVLNYCIALQGIFPSRP